MAERREVTPLSAHWWVGGVVGPAAFVAAWLGGGLVTDGYDPTQDAISRLAADGASTQAAMTAGFVAFGLAVPAFSMALRQNVRGPAWVATAASGLATLGVALAPLDRSQGLDRVHGLFAAAGYITLAAAPLLAAPSLRRAGRRGAARASVAAGILAGACLAATAAGPSRGLFQRSGLTLLDLWLVVMAIQIARGQSGGPAAGPPGAPGH